jgi:hypothetical protein
VQSSRKRDPSQINIELSQPPSRVYFSIVMECSAEDILVVIVPANDAQRSSGEARAKRQGKWSVPKKKQTLITLGMKHVPEGGMFLVCLYVCTYMDNPCRNAMACLTAWERWARHDDKQGVLRHATWMSAQIRWC